MKAPRPDHALIRELERIGALSAQRLELYYPRVRDREDISVLRDSDTGVLVLSRIDHVNQYYESRKEPEAYVVHGDLIKAPRLPDDARRAETLTTAIRGKHWLDFGCGLGGALDAMAAKAAWAGGLDLSRERQAIVRAKGHHAVSSLSEIASGSLDVVTLFHVLEHLPNPVEILQQIRRCLKPQGSLIVEVPHARDALITLYDCEAFKRFTFWSEHLVLHTTDSLRLTLEAAGFSLKHPPRGHQRYGLTNHLYWLSHGRPGGQAALAALDDTALERSYCDRLCTLGASDTLCANGEATTP